MKPEVGATEPRGRPIEIHGSRELSVGEDAEGAHDVQMTALCFGAGGALVDEQRFRDAASVRAALSPAPRKSSAGSAVGFGRTSSQAGGCVIQARTAAGAAGSSNS